MESAVTTIIDLEDSVATVDAEDKVSAYRNWLGLMDQTLSASFEKGGETLERRLNSDKEIVCLDGSSQTLKGRSLLLIRNVGHLMTSDLIKTQSNDEVPEGILDAVTTVAIGMVDLLKHRGNSNAGSIYIVKPKMHGPEEVGFANRLFESVEEMLGLDRNTCLLYTSDAADE